MENFKTYLKTRFHYTDQSLQLKTDHVKQYQNYCSEQQELHKLSFKELLKIIEIQRKKYSIQTTNNQLHSLECYFYYQIETGNRKDNPIENFRIKAEKPKLLQGFLNTEELDFIYENYPAKQKNRNKIYLIRNKIILGLMVYQGLGTGTIENLKTTDINLEKAQINVPKTSERKHNPRILPLESVQILQLHNYLKEHKKELETLLKIKENDPLLFPKREKARMKDITKMIKSDVQKYFEIKDLYQLRISRIILWLKVYNQREVQYKSGYKHLLRLEKYRENELESLKKAVEKYHIF
jgi:site-specific recombinase XerD